MAGARNLVIRFSSEADDFLRDLEAAVGGIDKMRQGLTGIAAIAASVSAATIGLGYAAVQTGGEFEQLLARLKTALGSEGAAQSAFKTIQAFAATTPYEVGQVTEAFISLQNRGIKPTTDTLRRLGDISGSQGKGLQQIVEALLDATQGEGERLKEFGINASFAGDKATISFKNLQQTVDKTPEGITKAILAIGEMKGVAGGMEQQAATLSGKMSNLSDASDSVSRAIFELVEGPLKAVVSTATDTINTFLALPPPLQKAVIVAGALTGAIASLTAAVIAFELANGRAAIANTLLTAAKLKDLAVTKSVTAAQIAWALATGTATVAQKDLAKNLAVGTVQVGLFAAAIASLALVGDTFLKIDAGARKLRDGTQSVEQALAGLAEVRAANSKQAEKSVADSELEAAAFKRTREEIGGVQRFLDDYIRGPLPLLATATEASISRQKVAFSDLALSVDKTLQEFNNFKAKGFNLVNKDELEAEKKAIEAGIAALEASIPVDAADAKAKRERALALQKAKAELDKFTAALPDSIKELEKLTKAFDTDTKAIALNADKRRVFIFESLVGQRQDSESVNAQITQIEIQSARDRLTKISAELDKLSALKASEKDPAKLEKINERIVQLESDSAKTRIEIAQKVVAERDRLEEESYNKLKEVNEKALSDVRDSETKRLIATQRAINAGLISEEQAATQRTTSRRQQLNDELYAKQQQLKQLEAFRFDNPDKEKQRQQEVRALRSETSQLTLQLLEAEKQKQDALQAEILKAISDRADADRNRSDRAIAALDREKSAYDNILAVMEQQNKLVESRLNLQKAISNLEQTFTQNRITSLSRAEAIRKQLDDGSIQDTQLRSQLEKELLELTGNSSLTQLQLIQRRQQAEDQLAAQQFAARQAEQAAAKNALENDIRRNQLLADRAVLEARIAELRAKQQVADAEIELEKARQSRDAQRIANAQKLVDLAKDGVKLAGDNVKLSQQAVADQAELAANSRTQLQIEQDTVSAREQAANITRENAQTEEIIKAGGNAGQNVRFNPTAQGYQQPFTVVQPSPQLIRESGLTPTTSPLAPKSSPLTPSIDFRASVTEILNQLKVMNSNFEIVARSPKTLNVSSPQPVTDAASIYSQIAYNNIVDSGLG